MGTKYNHDGILPPSWKLNLTCMKHITNDIDINGNKSNANDDIKNLFLTSNKNTSANTIIFKPLAINIE